MYDAWPISITHYMLMTNNQCLKLSSVSKTAAITDANKLVPFHSLKSLQLI